MLKTVSPIPTLSISRKTTHADGVATDVLDLVDEAGGLFVEDALEGAKLRPVDVAGLRGTCSRHKRHARWQNRP